MQMSKQTRDVFILAGALAVYGIVLWLYEAKLAASFGASLTNDPRAVFARLRRDAMVAEELSIPSTPVFTPPADTMDAAPLEDTDA